MILIASAVAAGSQSAVTLTPAVVEAGSPELIRVDAPASAMLQGEWAGHKLAFFRGRENRAWFALVGVDVEATAGPSQLRITENLPQTAPRDLTRTIEIHAAHYRTGTLTVLPETTLVGTTYIWALTVSTALELATPPATLATNTL